jgi:hypothetical protein
MSFAMVTHVKDDVHDVIVNCEHVSYLKVYPAGDENELCDVTFNFKDGSELDLTLKLDDVYKINKALSVTF